MDHLDDESLLARLPRRNDDEPPNLRQDLLDEVRDYLQSAWEEEQHHTADPHEAWQLVLQRFGDPAQLVRKLWFDTLKEQIMSRRLVLAAFGLVAVMFVAFAANNFRMLSALETTLADSQKTNGLLMEKLQSMQSQAQQSNTLLASTLDLLQKTPKAVDEASLTWRHLRLKLVAEDQSPVAGTVAIHGSPFGVSSSGGMQPNRETISRELDADGLVDFGPIHVGTYSVSIQLKNGYFTTIQPVALMPGEDRELSITCPVMPERTRKVTLMFVPSSLKESRLFPGWKIPDPESLWLLCNINNHGRRISDHVWSRLTSEFKPYTTLLVNSRGEAFEVNWPGDSRPPTEIAQHPLAQTIEDVRGRPWKGILPASYYSVFGTELVQLLEENQAEKLTTFKPVPRDSVDLTANEAVDTAAFDLSDTKATDDGTVNWTLPINRFAPSNGGMGGMMGGGYF